MKIYFQILGRQNVARFRAKIKGNVLARWRVPFTKTVSF